MKTTWSVLVLYETDALKQEAVRFCDKLVRRFWAENEFDFYWCSHARAMTERDGREAGEKLTHADMIVVASEERGDFGETFKLWLENWIHRRGEREGAMIGLADPGFKRGPLPVSDRFILLRNTAHRGGLDYLTRVPEQMTRSIPDSLESSGERASRITSVLADILHRPAPPRANRVGE
jgi:hypothetical protein